MFRRGLLSMKYFGRLAITLFLVFLFYLTFNMMIANLNESGKLKKLISKSLDNSRNCINFFSFKKVNQILSPLKVLIRYN